MYVVDYFYEVCFSISTFIHVFPSFEFQNADTDLYFIPPSLDKPVTIPIILPGHYSALLLLAQTINKLSEERTLEPSALIPTSFNRNKVSSETRKNVRTF